MQVIIFKAYPHFMYRYTCTCITLYCAIRIVPYCFLLDIHPPIHLLRMGHLSINVPSIAKLVACFYKCSPIFFAIIHSSQFVLSYGFTSCFGFLYCHMTL